ncbi:MAG: beta-ketoacyl-[acyl-carrier-protein] synthase family protein [Bacteroidetes bacterium]|nr:beta-ketoacyl-[acyl-carrier-protein] synthase family protein [Bacteroidota bacterium]
MSKIFVTGMGAISAIGNSVAENRTALIEEKSGIGKLTLFASAYADKRPCGEIKISTTSLKEKLSAHEPGVTRTTLLALHAFEEAIFDSGLNAEELGAPDTAFINATTVGGMCLTDELYHDANKTEDGSPYLSSYDCGSVALYIRDRYKIGGIVNTINTACSSSANAIMYGARLIHHGLAKRVIVGGTDSLAKFTINGFNALHILSPELCAPFDKDRKGLNLGEGAAYLVLEREQDIHNRQPYAQLTGYGNTNDAFHPSSISEQGDGPFLAMQQALHVAKIAADKIDSINAHGTGTENNDETESRAMLRVFGSPPAFASTKSYIGHTLGAAGAIEAVYSVLNIYRQEIYPSLQFKEPIQSTLLEPVLNYKKMQVNHVMSNSFGFGGNCTSLIFSKA